jgi:hypothetical protein
MNELSFGITVEPVSEPLICCAAGAINSLAFMVRPVWLLRIE